MQLIVMQLKSDLNYIWEILMFIASVRYSGTFHGLFFEIHQLSLKLSDFIHFRVASLLILRQLYIIMKQTGIFLAADSDGFGLPVKKIEDQLTNYTCIDKHLSRFYEMKKIHKTNLWKTYCSIPLTDVSVGLFGTSFSFWFAVSWTTTVFGFALKIGSMANNGVVWAV